MSSQTVVCNTAFLFSWFCFSLFTIHCLKLPARGVVQYQLHLFLLLHLVGFNKHESIVGQVIWHVLEKATECLFLNIISRLLLNTGLKKGFLAVLLKMKGSLALSVFYLLNFIPVDSFSKIYKVFLYET